MEPADRSNLALDELRGQWLDRLDENLASDRLSSQELSDLARRYRTLAETAESRGQRQAALTAAEHFERAAEDRIATSR
jgi:hypothetical protein